MAMVMEGFADVRSDNPEVAAPMIWADSIF